MDEQGNVCTFNVSALPIAAACAICGHSGMVHPHVGNRVPHCLLCELEQVIASYRSTD